MGRWKHFACRIGFCFQVSVLGFQELRSIADLCSKFAHKVRGQSEPGLEAAQDRPGLQEPFPG